MGCLDNHCRSLGSGYDLAHVTLELEAFWVGFELELKGTYSYCWVVDAEGRRYHPFCVCFVQCPCGLSIVEGVELV